jgi:hypothetical protein
MAAAATEHPQAAVLVFSGNAFTPRMEGVAFRGPPYYDLYTTDTERAIGIFRAVGAHVFLVGTPVDESSVTGWDRLDGIYRQLAQADPLAVTYVDAGAAVESPGRWLHLAVAVHEHGAELWCQRDQRCAVTRRHPLLPGRNTGDRRRHRAV